MSKFVVIAGPPSSGNRLFSAMVSRMIAASPTPEGFGHKIKIWHGFVGVPSPGVKGYDLYVLIPVRDPVSQEGSCKAGRIGCNLDEHAHGVAKFIAEHEDCSVRRISYEALLRWPNETTQYIASWLGLTWVGIPQDPKDNNPRQQNPYDGPLYDANLKYHDQPVAALGDG